MTNPLRKIGAGLALVAVTIYVTAGMAAATATTFAPATEAKAAFDGNWSSLLDVVKGMAPYVIGAGLTLWAIRKVVGSLSRAKAPTRF